MGALQLASGPPPMPAQVQVHGPAPDTAEAVPLVQSSLDGASETSTPLAGPHTPAWAEMGAVQVASLPPLAPRQFQLQGPEPEIAEASPALQRFDAGALGSAVPCAAPQAPSMEQVSRSGGLPR